jgi:hypothetical protein
MATLSDFFVFFDGLPSASRELNQGANTVHSQSQPASFAATLRHFFARRGKTTSDQQNSPRNEDNPLFLARSNRLHLHTIQSPSSPYQTTPWMCPSPANNRKTTG